MAKKLNRNQSNASSASVISDRGEIGNKENQVVPVDEEVPIMAQFEKKVKEVETARKLIETMKQNREKDETEIRRLTENEASLIGQISSLESEVCALKIDLADYSGEANGQIADLRQLIDERTAAIEVLRDQLSDAQSCSLKKDSVFETLKTESDGRIADLEKRIQQSEFHKSKLEASLSEKDALVSSIESESKKVVHEKDLLTKDVTLWKQKSFESEKSLGNAKLELEAKVKQINILEEELAGIKKIQTEKKRETELLKLENDRKLRSVESRQIQAEDSVRELSKKLIEAETCEKQLREEIEGLLHQQTLAIERISQSNALRNATEITCKEAIEKAREACARVSVVEKQLKHTEEQAGELRKQLSSKIDAIKVLELQSAKDIEKEKKKTNNVAIITSVVVLVVSRLIFA